MRSAHALFLAVIFLLTATCSVAASDTDPGNGGYPQMEDGVDQENTPPATPLEPAFSCGLGKNGEHTFHLLKQESGSGYVYYKQYDNTPPVLLRDYGEGDFSLRDREFYSSLTDGAEISCMGAREKVFVLTAAWNGRLMSATVIRYNSKAARWEEAAMATPRHPEYVYTNENHFLAVTSNSPQDRDAPDHIYDVMDSTTRQVRQMRGLPAPKGYQVIRLSVTHRIEPD